MPLIKTSGIGSWFGKKMLKGGLGIGKAITKGVALPAATGTVKGLAHTANFLGKQIVKSPTTVMTVGASALTAKELAGKHLGQSWKMNQYAPIRFN